MQPKGWEFSPLEHVRFLDGYLDAVGRGLTTDCQLVSLTARTVQRESEIEQILGVPLGDRTAVGNWSREFGNFVETVLSMDQRGRLGFYLIEYICCFE